MKKPVKKTKITPIERVFIHRYDAEELTTGDRPDVVAFGDEMLTLDGEDTAEVVVYVREKLIEISSSVACTEKEKY